MTFESATQYHIYLQIKCSTSNHLVLSYSCPLDSSARRYELGSAPGPGASPGKEETIRTKEAGKIPLLPPHSPLPCRALVELETKVKRRFAKISQS